MRVVKNLCDAKGCKRVAVEAYDVRNAWRAAGNDMNVVRHYEVCAKHAKLFNGGGWLHCTIAERIKKKLVPS